jgi:hypothetical protein
MDPEVYDCDESYDSTQQQKCQKRGVFYLTVHCNLTNQMSNMTVRRVRITLPAIYIVVSRRMRRKRVKRARIMSRGRRSMIIRMAIVLVFDFHV